MHLLAGRSLSALIATALIGKALPFLGGFENLEGAHECFVDTHHGPGVVEFSAVIGSGEERNKLTTGKELVTVFDDLMRPANEVEVVFVQELCDNIFSKGEGDTPIIFSPSVNFLVGVGPEQVAEESRVGHISGADNAFDLIEAGEFRAESSVHAKYFFVNDGGGREAVEAVGECFPKFDSKASLAFIIESVDAVDGSTLVISTEDEEVFRVLDLVGEEQANGF